jgi:integrase
MQRRASRRSPHHEIRHQPDGRIVQTVPGHPPDSAYSAVWAEARKQALIPAQFWSPPGHRPYDLRHISVSRWLNSGAPTATEVARRTGHGVVVLLKIHTHRIDGQADAANQRIADGRRAEDDNGASEEAS